METFKITFIILTFLCCSVDARLKIEKNFNNMLHDEFNIIVPTAHTHLNLNTVLSREAHFYLNYITSFIGIYGGALFLQLFDVYLTREQISKATQAWSAYYMGRELFRDFYYSEKTTLWDLIILAILSAQYWYHHRTIIKQTVIPFIKHYGNSTLHHLQYGL